MKAFTTLLIRNFYVFIEKDSLKITLRINVKTKARNKLLSATARNNSVA